VRFVPILVAATLGGVSAPGCGRPPAPTAAQEPPQAEKDRQAVRRVLLADRELAWKRDAIPPGATPSQVAWAVGRYCDDLERLDTSDCPADVRVAYRHHAGAWREAEAAIRQLPEDFLDGLLKGAANSVLRGEPDGGLGRLEGGVRRSLERFRDTRIEVEKVAARYGAAL
jgi:hypothetical protein